MIGFLFDTCFVCELVKPAPNPNVRTWVQAVDPMSAFLSVMSIAEIRNGIERRARDERRRFLESWLSYELPKAFNGRILSFDSEIADRYGRLKARADASGRIGVSDAIIAATALHYNLAVVTRNAGDFEPLGVSVVNPWL